MAFNFPHAGLVINIAGDGTVDTPVGHPINATTFSRMAVNNGALGTMDYPLITLTGLGYALSRRNPNVVGELDALHYGIEGLDLPAIFGAITTAANAGFAATTPAGDPLEVGFGVIREAMEWAQSNLGALRPLTAADFYVLPALGGGGNPPRFRISYSLLVEPSTCLMRAAVEVVCLGGFVHTVASRNNASRYAQFYDLVIDELSNPPIANQAAAFSRVFTHSGLPPQLAVYPVALGERYSHPLLRFHYVGGSHAERRAAFLLYVPLLLPMLPTLRSFLAPSTGPDMVADAYALLITRIHRSVQNPPDQTIYLYRTAVDLSSLLEEMPEIPQRANAAVPVQNASERAQAAVTEWDRRRQVVSNSAGGGATSLPGSTVTNISASRTGRQQLTSVLLPMAFFGPAEADLLRLAGAAPTNEFPCLKRGMQTKNVVFVQVATGRLRGISDVSPGLAVLESCSGAFLKYVDHTTVMNKAPAINPGARPPHTMAYNQEEFTHVFLLNNREKFVALNFLSLSAKIKSAREQILEQSVSTSSKLFASAENVALLKYFSHYLDAFEFDFTGPGSWDDAMDRIEKFRQNGLSMPGDSLSNHFDNCQKAYDILIGELFDGVAHFAQPREAPNVAQLLSRRVFEANGPFDQHLTFQNQNTSTLNGLLMLNPSFGKVMGGSSSSTPPGHEEDEGSGGKWPKPKAKSVKFKFDKGTLTFGDPKSGVKYDTTAIFEELKKVDSKITRNNFCILNYLSTTQCCTLSKHKNGNWHKYAQNILKRRADFEHAPFRLDSKAKATK